MEQVNKMGMRVALVTAVVLVVLWGVYWGGKTLLKTGSEQAGKESAEQETVDSDGDGIADNFETAYYKTDPHKKDSDGDGVSDLDEILGGRDPLVPGPNDEIKPATGGEVTEKMNYTERYLAELPQDVPNEEILNKERLEIFVEANKGVLLPQLADEEIKITTASDKKAVENYLNQVSAKHNEEIKVVTSTDIEAAWQAQAGEGLTEAVAEVADALDRNLKTIKEVEVPAEVVNFHKKLVAASTALRDNVGLLAKTKTDFVGTLIGAKNIEELGPVFKELANEMAALEEKYGIE